MSSFVEIPADFLASIATDEDRIPRLYFEGNPVTRAVFWLRLRWIHALALRHADRSRPCLDFGAGGGVLLPTLAQTFDDVVSVDLVTTEAQRVAEHYGLERARIVEADATRAELPGAPFGTIVAADVLEHFADLAPPLDAIHRMLADDGVLLTSLPSETGFYEWLRRVQGVEKPEDHYHTAAEVEAALEARGFERIAGRFVPLWVRVAPLYYISAWRKRPLR